MKKTLGVIIATGMLMTSSIAIAAPQKAVFNMTFENCQLMIRQTAVNLGQAPINIVETSMLHIVRFVTNDGSNDSVLVTCSKPDNKAMMIVR